MNGKWILGGFAGIFLCVIFYSPLNALAIAQGTDITGIILSASFLAVCSIIAGFVTN